MIQYNRVGLSGEPEREPLLNSKDKALMVSIFAVVVLLIAILL